MDRSRIVGIKEQGESNTSVQVLVGGEAEQTKEISESKVSYFLNFSQNNRREYLSYFKRFLEVRKAILIFLPQS